jgi:hypothetical protein
MQWQANPNQMADEWAIQRLARLYAYGMDRNQPDVIEAIFTEDGVIDRAGQLREGRANLRKIPPWLRERYLATMHKIHNQLITVTGENTAEGETYCAAEHLERDRTGGTSLFCMAIRYQDKMVKEAGVWRFKRRQLIIEWTDVHPVVAQNPDVLAAMATIKV